MSISTNSLFNKGKNQTPTNATSKQSESHLFAMQSNSQPKKIDYSRITEITNFGGSNHLSENVVLNGSELEKRNYHSQNEEIVIKPAVMNKFDSPKVCGKRGKRKFSSSSNLPTANNSFHTNISSPEHDKNVNLEEYKGLVPNYGNSQSRSGKRGIRKPSDCDSAEAEINSVSSLNTSVTGGVNPKQKKSDDFKVKFKTEKCKFYEIDKHCKFGENCAFAHGDTDLRKKSTVTSAYRTKKCKQFFENGFCPYGNRCQFAHALKSNSENIVAISYKKYLNLISNPEEIENLTNSKPNSILNINKPRLAIFKKIAKNKDSKNRSSFVEDIKKLHEENRTNTCNKSHIISSNRSRVFSY